MSLAEDMYRKVKKFTVCKKIKSLLTIELCIQLEENKIEGDFIECGVYRGGQIMAMMIAMNDLNTKRDIYLYDTFQGLPKPEDWEISKKGKSALKKYNKLKTENGFSDWCRAYIDEVKKNVFSIPYDKSKIHFVEGMVEDTLKKANHDKIALLRLDTDFYSSTKVEMEILYPKLVSGGALIIDDYNYWSGSKKAVNEYFEKNNINLKLEHRTGSGAFMIKE
jgi:hypothetical protein